MNAQLMLSIRKACLLLPLLCLSLSVSAQDPAYQKAVQEIKDEFGSFPSFFQVYPDYALASAWENFKQMGSPNSPLPPKYRELLQLAVASQIPCSYCIYFHTAAAKAHGATDAEIHDAIAQGAQTRHWSMILQGNQIDFEKFKKEFDGMMRYMASKASK